MAPNNDVYIFIHTHTVQIYTYVYIYTYLYILYIFVHIYTYLNIFIHIFTYLYIACVNVYTHIYIYIVITLGAWSFMRQQQVLHILLWSISTSFMKIVRVETLVSVLNYMGTKFHSFQIPGYDMWLAIMPRWLAIGNSWQTSRTAGLTFRPKLPSSKCALKRGVMAAFPQNQIGKD